jgi:hypothetical protein
MWIGEAWQESRSLALVLWTAAALALVGVLTLTAMMVLTR